MAMELFWQQGYEATSVADLVSRLGINRFSLYNSYGDKLSLYRESLKYYLDHYSQPKLLPLAEDKGIDGVLIYIDRFVAIQREQKYGCFLQNAILEKIISDGVVKEQCDRLFEGMQAAFCQSFAYSKAHGELIEGACPLKVSRFIMMQLQGIRVLGKARQFEVIRDAVALLVEYLEGLKVTASE